MPTVNPVVANTWKVVETVTDSLSGDQWLNIFNVTAVPPGDWDDTNVDAVAAVFHDAWNDHLKGATPATAALTEITITNLDIEHGQQLSYGYSLDGTGVGQALPNQTAAVVTWRTGRTGRSFRGRSFIGPMTEDLSEGRVISATAITALNAWAQDLLDGLDALDSSLLVVSRYTLDPDAVPPAPRSVPRDVNIATIIESFIVRPQWRTQRRRAS